MAMKIVDDSKSYKYYNLSGGLDYDSSKVSMLQDTSQPLPAYDLQNVEMYALEDYDEYNRRVGIRKQNGNKNVLESHSFTKSIVGIGQYLQSGRPILVFNTLDGGFYRCSELDFKPSERKTGLLETDKYSYTNINNVIIVNNGKQDPFAFGVGIAGEIEQCGMPSSYWGLPLTERGGRLFSASDNVLGWSAIGTYTNWTAAGDAGDATDIFGGGVIRALTEFDDKLIIHRNDKCFQLVGDYEESIQIDPRNFEGAVCQSAVFKQEGSYYFFDGAAVRSLMYDALYQLNVGADNLAAKIRGWLLKNYDTKRAHDVIVVPYPRKKQLWMYLPTKDCKEGVDTALIYSFELNSWTIRKQQAIQCAALVGDYIYTGTATGELLQEDTGNTFDGALIVAYWFSPYFHFGNPNKRKDVEAFYLTVLATGRDSFQLVRRFNGKDIVEKVKTITLTDKDIAAFDDSGSVFDTAKFLYRYYKIKRTTIGSGFYSISVGIRDTGSLNQWAIEGFEFDGVEVDD